MSEFFQETNRHWTAVRIIASPGVCQTSEAGVGLMVVLVRLTAPSRRSLFLDQRYDFGVRGAEPRIAARGTR
jgi:hypothetical protein